MKQGLTMVHGHVAQVLPYEPVPCKHCTAILNPYARVDFNSK